VAKTREQWHLRPYLDERWRGISTWFEAAKSAAALCPSYIIVYLLTETHFNELFRITKSEPPIASNPVKLAY